jgi:eukaryotic-like serine/threonine-protein kinase
MVERCLQKNPDERWQSARDLAADLRWLCDPGSTHITRATPARKRALLFLALAALLAVAVAIPFLLRWGRSAPVARTFRFSILPPEGRTFGQHPVVAELAVSPDGKALAMIACEGRRRRLFIRPLDSVTAREVEGTDGAGGPFWSPDSKWIGFFAGGLLKKFPLAGGPIQTVCNAQGDAGSWNKTGQIIFSEWGPVASESIRAVPDSEGQVRDVTDGSRGSALWPSFLPDGRHFVFFGFFKSDPGIYVGSLDDPKDLRLLIRVRSRAEVHGEQIYYSRPFRCRSGRSPRSGGATSPVT